MADSINRIVPPSVSVDRSSALGREREKKKKGEPQTQKPPVPSVEPVHGEKSLPQDGGEKVKGNKLDINV